MSLLNMYQHHCFNEQEVLGFFSKGMGMAVNPANKALLEKVGAATQGTGIGEIKTPGTPLMVMYDKDCITMAQLDYGIDQVRKLSGLGQNTNSSSNPNLKTIAAGSDGTAIGRITTPHTGVPTGLPLMML